VRSISGKDLLRVLRERGWEVKRVNGSHHILAKEGSIVRLSVPVHGATPLKAGLLRHILKLANLTEADL
jgi:predicted RNA binding protein YcfA (HicA-like mRNA interferase family)